MSLIRNEFPVIVGPAHFIGTQVTSAASNYTRLCRITLLEQSTAQGAIVNIVFWDHTQGTSVPDFGEVLIDCVQNSALGNNPTVNITVRALNLVSVDYTSFKAYFETVDSNSSVIDIYVRSAAGTLDIGFALKFLA